METLRFALAGCVAFVTAAALSGPYAALWEGADLALGDARISSVPFCRVWPGHQREMSQTEMSHFVGLTGRREAS